MDARHLDSQQPSPLWAVVRRSAILLLLLLAAAAVWRLTSTQGWLAPIRVVSGSMADALWGVHYAVACGDCQFSYAVGMEQWPADNRLVCPNCGYARNAGPPAHPQPGSRVLIDKAAYRFRGPRRWELVAFAPPHAPRQWSVKRIVALPNEQPSIRAGQLLLDGAILRKSLRELREMAILVHDDQHRPQPAKGLPQRWIPAWRPTGWTASNGYRYREAESELSAVELPADPRPKIQWLYYHHWRCVANPLPRSDPAPVMDSYGYNQQLSRQLHRVTDLLLCCDGRLHGQGIFALMAHDGRQRFEVVLDTLNHRATLWRDDQRQKDAQLPPSIWAQPVRLELALCDQQLIFAINGQERIVYPYVPSTAARIPIARPLGLGACKLSADVQRLRVFRDLYYLDPLGLGRPWTLGRPLERDEFLVLGDNVPISQDSRLENRGLPRKFILGKVLSPASWPQDSAAARRRGQAPGH